MIYLVGKNIGDYGGGAVVASEIMDSLNGSNLDVAVISMGYNISKKFPDKILMIPHIKMPYLPYKNDYPHDIRGTIRFWLKRFEYSVKWLNLKFQLWKNPPTTMIFNDTFHATRDILDEYKKLSPSIQIIHVSPKFVRDFFGGYPFENCLEDYSKANVLLFVSDKCRKEWIKHKQLIDKKAKYIPNCANEIEARSYLSLSKVETRKNLNFKPDSFYMVNVGNIKSRKGQDLLIEAAPELKKIAPNLEILIVGSGGEEYISKLKEMVNQKNLDFIQFTGRKSNAMEYIYASDLFILPSRAEALPLVLLEAMILKTPMIGSDIDGVPEMIEHAKTGLLFESENIDEMVKVFGKVYRDPERGEQYAVQASKRYWKKFSKEQFTKRYVDLVRGVMNG